MTIGRPNATMVDRDRSRGVTSIFEIPLSIVKREKCYSRELIIDG
jgi:hypothetical protein